jgi:hypothetical protein
MMEWRMEASYVAGNAEDVESKQYVIVEVAENLRRLSLDEELSEAVLEGFGNMSLMDVDHEQMVWRAHPNLVRTSRSWPLHQPAREEVHDGLMDVSVG